MSENHEFMHEAFRNIPSPKDKPRRYVFVEKSKTPVIIVDTNNVLKRTNPNIKEIPNENQKRRKNFGRA